MCATHTVNSQTEAAWSRIPAGGSSILCQILLIEGGPQTEGVVINTVRVLNTCRSRFACK